MIRNEPENRINENKYKRHEDADSAQYTHTIYSTRIHNVRA